MSKLRAAVCLALLTLTFAHRAAARQAEARTPYRLSLPGENWALDIDLTDFNIPVRVPPPTVAKEKVYALPSGVPIEEVTDDGSRYQLLAFRKEKEKSDTSFSMLLINFRPAQAAGTAADFRDSHIRNLTKSKSLAGGKAKTSEHNGVPVASYKISPVFLGYSLSPVALIQAGQRTLQAYYVKDGVWVTITLTAGDLGEAEERLFYSLLDSARFVDTSAPSTSFDYYHLGRVLYLSEDYYKAAGPLTMAVALEHRERRLDTASWRDLVAKLIDSLSRSGEVKKSKELMDYAVARDPSYPMFEMALAIYHAHYGDLDKTIEHLEKAFLNRQNAMFAPLPDPLLHPAFGRFRKDERFKKAVKEMKKKQKD
jgi:tetratricopeptide (TPR) repeat protein